MNSRLLAGALLSLASLAAPRSSFAQLNTAPLPTPRPIGIGSELLPPGTGWGPKDQMHVHGYATHPTYEGKNPAYRLSYGNESNIEHVNSQWAIATGNGHHSTIANQYDVILKINQNAEDLILSTSRGAMLYPFNGDGSAIRLATSEGPVGPQKERVTVLSNGNVGIGKSTPQAILELPNELTFGQNSIGNYIGSNYRFGLDYLTPTTFDLSSDHADRRITNLKTRGSFMYFDDDAALFSSIGWAHMDPIGGASSTELDWLNRKCMYWTSQGNLVVNSSGTGAFPKNTLELHGNGTIGNGYARNFNAPPNGLLVEGSVIIGTTLPIDPNAVGDNIPQPPDYLPSNYPSDPNSVYKLVVNGSVLAKEVLVTTEWADFVFDPEYKLPTLSEVENHIHDYGHLPDVPSAAEVDAQGVAIGKSQATLLQKIEELTLYAIEADKRIKLLEEKINVVTSSSRR